MKEIRDCENDKTKDDRNNTDFCLIERRKNKALQDSLVSHVGK